MKKLFLVLVFALLFSFSGNGHSAWCEATAELCASTISVQYTPPNEVCNASSSPTAGVIVIYTAWGTFLRRSITRCPLSCI